MTIFFAPALRLNDAILYDGANTEAVCAFLGSDFASDKPGEFFRDEPHGPYDETRYCVESGDWFWKFDNGTVELSSDAPLTVTHLEWGTLYSDASPNPGAVASQFPFIHNEKQARRHAEHCAPYQRVANREHLSDGTVLPWREVQS